MKKLYFYLVPFLLIAAPAFANNVEVNKYARYYANLIACDTGERYNICRNASQSNAQGYSAITIIVMGYESYLAQRNWDLAGYRMAENYFVSRGGCPRVW